MYFTRGIQNFSEGRCMYLSVRLARPCIPFVMGYSSQMRLSQLLLASAVTLDSLLKGEVP